MLRAAQMSLSLLRDPKMFWYRRESRVIAHAPFPMSSYRDILADLKSSNTSLPPFLSNEKHNGSVFYTRHDIDTLACVQNSVSLARINVSMDVPTAAYFRVDAEEYDLAEHADTVHTLVKMGIEVGLHTSCYAADDPFSQLHADVESFADATGIHPISFTLHGLGFYKLKNRLKFRHAIANRLDEFGFEFTDCSRRIRAYRHVIQDCHTDPKSGRRCLLSDVRQVKKLAGIPGRYLVLTHPCYWK